MSKPIGAAGLALIKRFEGCRLTAYKPVPTEKYWTIGWGHYGPDVREGDRITQAEADSMLAADCQRFANAVDDLGYVPLTDKLNANQRDALISFTFNCGAGCLKTLCKGRSLPQICTAMEKYNKAGGKVLVGLMRRRAAEQALFTTPIKEEANMNNNIPDSYAAEAVKWAQENKIIQGDANGSLQLHQTCTVQKVVVLLWRFAKLLGRA